MNQQDKELLLRDLCGRLPTTWPFCTKWKIDKAGLTKDELLKWFKTSCLGYRNITIKL